MDVEPVGRRRICHLREEPFEEIGDGVDSFQELTFERTYAAPVAEVWEA